MTESPTTRENIEAILADKVAAEALPRQIGFFALHKELSGRHKRLSEILNLIEGSPVALREGCYDGERLLIRVVDILRLLAADRYVSDEDLDDLLRLSINGPYYTNILLDEADGGVTEFSTVDPSKSEFG